MMVPHAGVRAGNPWRPRSQPRDVSDPPVQDGIRQGHPQEPARQGKCRRLLGSRGCRPLSRCHSDSSDMSASYLHGHQLSVERLEDSSVEQQVQPGWVVDVGGSLIRRLEYRIVLGTRKSRRRCPTYAHLVRDRRHLSRGTCRLRAGSKQIDLPGPDLLQPIARNGMGVYRLAGATGLMKALIRSYFAGGDNPLCELVGRPCFQGLPVA